MYSETTGSRKAIGDVDVLYHDGLYHLFHLVLPNHDYIAHAVSNNCFDWRRVENALFIGDPGGWDDSMLWTVHVTPHPHRRGVWRMFYTGLSRRDLGKKQRIGLAESDDLYRWTKAPVWWVDRRSELPYELPGRPPQPPFAYDPRSSFPLGPCDEFYESEVDEGRHWVSWRDPFYYCEGDRGWLLAAGRVKHGPLIRRGCIALMEEVGENRFECRPPLHHPGTYDDIEVPNLFRIDEDYFLVGSIREDAKVRYWHADSMQSRFESCADNVLLASGNYAGRVTRDDRGLLLWSFYTPGQGDRTVHNLMPPPKRLVRSGPGHLEVRPFEGFDERVTGDIPIDRVCGLLDREGATCQRVGEETLRLKGCSGFQAFVFDEILDDFRMSVDLKLLSDGKCGLVFRIDRDSHDGYYLSLDLFKGVAQLRAWGSREDAIGESLVDFESLQDGYWLGEKRGEARLTLVAYGSYVELQVGRRVLLSLADQRFRRGALGFYVESAELLVSSLRLERLQSPRQSDEHLAEG